MQAMIFAAGLGTRLRPLTNDRPKALVEINGKTLLELAIRYVQRFGYDRIIVNVHHFADKVVAHLDKHDNFGASVLISDETDELLETGGGLKKAMPFFNHEPLLVWNVDIISNIDLHKMHEAHLRSNALATLATRQRDTSRYLLFKNQELVGWKNINTEEIKMSKGTFSSELDSLAFSGIHIIDPRLFPLITDEGKFSIIKTYLEVAKEYKLQSFRHDETAWVDVGKIPNIPIAEQLARELFP